MSWPHAGRVRSPINSGSSRLEFVIRGRLKSRGGSREGALGRMARRERRASPAARPVPTFRYSPPPPRRAVRSPAIAGRPDGPKHPWLARDQPSPFPLRHLGPPGCAQREPSLLFRRPLREIFRFGWREAGASKAKCVPNPAVAGLGTSAKITSEAPVGWRRVERWNLHFLHKKPLGGSYFLNAARRTSWHRDQWTYPKPTPANVNRTNHTSVS